MSYAQLSFEQRCLAFRQWLTTPLGRGLMVDEHRHFNQLLEPLFGHQLLQLSAAGQPFYQAGDILYKTLLDFVPNNVTDKTRIIGSAFEMPIASESIDVMLMQHVLELSDDPYQILREIVRVLSPSGHLLLCGFNPWSLWGLRKALLMGQNSDAVWKAHYISTHRLREWLRLLGFEVKCVQYTAQQLPLQMAARFCEVDQERAWAKQLPWGGVYFLVAKKSVRALTPFKFARPSFATKLINASVAAGATSYDKKTTKE